jgi:hypothetical protein
MDMSQHRRVADFIGVIEKVVPPAVTGSRIPISIALWDIGVIAEYILRSESYVRNVIVAVPTFPRAVRLPGPNKSQALYLAREVVAWAEGYRESK